MAAPKYIMFFFNWRSCCLQTLEGIWNNYVDIEQKAMHVIFIIFLSTWGYNSLGDPGTKFERKYFYKLIRSKGWQHASWRRTQNKNSTIQHIRPNFTRKWPKWNEIAQRIWLWLSGFSYTVPLELDGGCNYLNHFVI